MSQSNGVISLAKKMDDLKASGHGDIATMVNAVSISLKKSGLDSHKAKVALCMDISGSMSSMFRNGTVVNIVKKALAQAVLFDDDGNIDLFYFGEYASYVGEVGSNEISSLCEEIPMTDLQGYTYYDKGIECIVNHYADDKSGLPVFVIFITDGSPSDKYAAEKAIVKASSKPIFFQFVGVGSGDYFPNEAPQETKKSSFLGSLFSSGKSNANDVPSEFEFLSKLDTLKGRSVDNAGFFAVGNPATFDSQKLYDLLLGEYPSWVREVKTKGWIS